MYAIDRAHALAGHRPATRSYVICATPRSGSSWLCEHLAGLGIAGAPTEYFDQTIHRELSAHWGTTTPRQYIERLTTQRTTPNGLFGTKLLLDQCREWFVDPALLELLPDLRVIRLRRRDRLGQALSLARALQTGQWASHLPAQSMPRYDASLIHRCVETLVRDESGWDVLFRTLGVEPCVVTYEELVEHPKRVLGAVLQALGLQTPPLSLRPTHLRRQADTVTEEWRQRFEEEVAER